MTSKGINRWVIAVIAAIGLNAGIINLGYFFGGGNTLPIQLLLSLITLSILFRIKVTSIEFFLAFLLVSILILSYNLSDPLAIVTNPCLPLLGLMAFLAGTRLRTRNQQTLANVAIAFLAFQIVFHLFFNLTFSPTDSVFGRSKGFGSGTTYALMAATLLIYLTSMVNQRRLSLLAFCALAAIPVWTIFLTQSRGVFLSLVIILVIKNLFRIRTFFKLLALVAVTVLTLTLNPTLLDNVPLFQRFQIGSELDLNSISSGRILGQLAILNWIADESSLLSLLLGAEGLNGIKQLISQGYEFPHLDLLYLVYDTGLLGAGLYLFLAVSLIARTQLDSYILLFFLSALHTNMILSPAFLVLSIALHHENRQTSQSTRLTGRHLRIPLFRRFRSFETS